MKTKVLPTNPFYNQPNFAFGYDLIKEGQCILDYGCFDARFGKKLLSYKKVNYYGVDKNAEIIAFQDLNSSLNVSIVSHPLLFPDDYFDVVVMFEVLEHIEDQQTTLRELHRVLKPDGTLVLSVPRKHIFSFLDMANWKFLFPRLHQFYYRLNHSENEYRKRYIDSPHGLVGDIEKEKGWHQHFRDEEMISLLNKSGFAIHILDGSGFFRFLMTDIGYILRMPWLFTQKIRNLDSYQFSAAQMICSSKKIL